MKKGTKIETPIKSFIKDYKDFEGKTYYSFLHNKSEKNKDTNEWEIKERYVINVMNMKIVENQKITITEIIEAKPQIMKDKKGKEYLNCILYVNASEHSENYADYNKQQENFNPNVDMFGGSSEDNLPF